jgi:hypothetical protein
MTDERTTAPDPEALAALGAKLWEFDRIMAVAALAARVAESGDTEGFFFNTIGDAFTNSWNKATDPNLWTGSGSVGEWTTNTVNNYNFGHHLRKL